MSSENDYLLAINDIESYEGKWVAVLNGKIICKGNTLQETKDKFEKSSIKELPTYDRIPRKTESVTFIF